MRMRVVRFQSRNPLVVALFVALLLALIVALLTVGLAVGAGLAAVGGAALLVRRALGRRLPPADRRALDARAGLDPGREVFPSSADSADDRSRRLPPGAG